MWRSDLEDDSLADAGPDMTSLIDILVVLMCTFVLLIPASQLATADLELSQLDSGTTAIQAEEDIEMVMIGVDADGQLTWNQEPLDRSDLGQRLANAPESARFLVAGDQRAELGPVLQVAGRISEAGFTAQLVTQQTSSQSP
ncbi:MAG: biopolymer transporter ExbD [Planctomycetaceae bacterium]|nr:biopolymer transporter ExbD [Planctomycetaceae bacterium]